MNPTFMAFYQAMTKAGFDMLMGVPYVPKKDRPSPTDGKLFAATGAERDDNGFPRSDMIVAAEEEERERNARAYLDNLAEEVKNRNQPSEPTPEDAQLRRNTHHG